MIKAIIFDLDDTLFDCTGTLVDSARKRAARALHKAGFPEKEEVIYKKINLLSEKHGAKADVFGMLCKKYSLDERHTNRMVDIALNAYNSEVVEDIKLFDDVLPILAKLRNHYRLALVTSGAYARQKRKIQILELEKEFDLVHIDSEEEGRTKTDYFNDVLEKFQLKPNEVITIGDRVVSEIKVGNRLGMYTVQMMHGRHRNVVPKSDLEEPDYRISRISELMKIIDSISEKKKFSELKIVCIGGGTGMPTVLEGLKQHTDNLTAIVGVTDSGRSSGMLRKDMGILPPGDIRNNLIALSDSEKLLHDLFQYRFKNGGLEGHSLGNLLIAGLSDITGNFEHAIGEVSRILNIKGKVLPVSLEDSHLCAELSDGSVEVGEDNITKRFKNEKCRNPIKRIFLKEQTPANPKAVKAIEEADCIIIGPGSLYVSVLNNLLHKEIRDAINRNKIAKKIYVCNIVTQPYQTDDFKASTHVKEVLKYLEGSIDYVIVNKEIPRKDVVDRYRKDDSLLVEPDVNEIQKMGIAVILSDVVEETTEERVIYAKRDLLRHDADKIASEVVRLF